MALSKQQILAAVDLPIEEVEVPEWGGYVYVRGLNGEERDAFELSIIDQKNKGKVNLENIRAKLCALTLCDDKGERLFTDKEVFALSKKSGSVLGRLFLVAQRLSGLSENDVQEMTENFLSVQKGDSTSD